MTEGIEERKETGVLLGRRENLVLAPAHEVEPVEKRFGPFLTFYSDSTCVKKVIVVMQFENFFFLFNLGRPSEGRNGQ